MTIYKNTMRLFMRTLSVSIPYVLLQIAENVFQIYAVSDVMILHMPQMCFKDTRSQYIFRVRRPAWDI